MLARRLQPPRRKRKASGDNKQHEKTGKRSQKIKQLPQEVSPSLALPAAPALPDVTFFNDDAVEQNEAHHTADVHENDAQRERGDYEDCDQAGQEYGINSGKTRIEKVPRGSRVSREVEVGAVESASGAEFSGQ